MIALRSVGRGSRHARGFAARFALYILRRCSRTNVNASYTFLLTLDAVAKYPAYLRSKCRLPGRRIKGFFINRGMPGRVMLMLEFPRTLFTLDNNGRPQVFSSR